MFELIVKYYDKGLYSLGDVYNFVLSGQITQEEYNTVAGLTGDPEIDAILLADETESRLY
ncbi:MAG: XkdX family protein [Lachnospiraceae bacterium]|nr:XkdX family protein [Lachnospiraceae bacterium]